MKSRTPLGLSINEQTPINKDLLEGLMEHLLQGSWLAECHRRNSGKQIQFKPIFGPVASYV